jgi:hypothetical protein
VAAAVVAVEEHADGVLEVVGDVVAAVGGGGVVEERVAADADVTEKIRRLEMRVEEASSIDQPRQHACLLRFVVLQPRQLHSY